MISRIAHIGLAMGSTVVMAIAWAVTGLFVWFVWWLSGLAYDVHWGVGLPVRIMAMMLGGSWVLAGLTMLVMGLGALFTAIRGVEDES